MAYPAVASKLGLLSPDALFCVTQFYFRLSVIQREIDDLLNDKYVFAAEADLVKVKKALRGRNGKIAGRSWPGIACVGQLES